MTTLTTFGHSAIDADGMMIWKDKKNVLNKADNGISLSFWYEKSVYDWMRGQKAFYDEPCGVADRDQKTHFTHFQVT